MTEVEDKLPSSLPSLIMEAEKPKVDNKPTKKRLDELEKTLEHKDKKTLIEIILLLAKGCFV